MCLLSMLLPLLSHWGSTWLVEEQGVIRKTVGENSHSESRIQIRALLCEQMRPLKRLTAILLPQHGAQHTLNVKKNYSVSSCLLLLTPVAPCLVHAVCLVLSFLQMEQTVKQTHHSLQQNPRCSEQKTELFLLQAGTPVQPTAFKNLIRQAHAHLVA